MADKSHQERRWWQSRSGLALLGFLAIAGFYLVTEHRAHLFGVLPYLLILACPLMHFLHRGHGGGHGGHRGGNSGRQGAGSMSAEPAAYGLWVLVVLNVLVFAICAFSFTRPRTARDWRSFGAFTAFLVALFTEMYGFPLTIYLLSGWLQRRYPGLDLLTHDAGHLWETLLGWRGDPHLNPLHLLSNLLIAGGFVLLAAAWRVLYEAQQAGRLATTGPYGRMRHPQYVGFILIMFGFLLQWPTLLTLAMFPVLVWMYVRLARAEEREVAREFGGEYARYAARTPAFIPRLRRPTPRPA